MKVIDDDRKQSLLSAAVVNTWEHKLRNQVNDYWSETTGDLKFLLCTDDITYHLYDWAVQTERIEKLPQYPFHRVCTEIAPAFHADRTAFETEANNYIRRRMTERQAERERARNTPPNMKESS